tara:strand:- start:13156 stop:13671 length:516 start_codon:yes stop_codon:yes gene_type:complete
MLSFGDYSLRPLCEQDASSLALYANNRKVWLNLRDRFPSPYQQDDAEQFITLCQTLQEGQILAICTSQECIGIIGLEIGVDVHCKTAELGYWLGEPFWGRGIMSQAVRCFTDFAHSKFGLLRIYAEPFSSNQASGRVLEKAGFDLEGILRKNAFKNGEVLDSMLYAKTWDE